MNDVMLMQCNEASPLIPTPLSIEEEWALRGYNYVPKEKVIAFTGPRGSGKSLSMVWFIIHWMITTGLPVYSNMKVIYRGLQTLNLDMIDFATQTLNTCLVCIDEVQLWADRRNWASTRSKILAYIQMQLRKEQMSFMFTIQDINWMDKRMGFQVDTLCECTDEYFKNQHNRKLGRRARKPGQFIHIDIKDISGVSTGVPFYKSGMVQTRRLGPNDTFWGSYDTWETQDISEAWTRFEMRGRKVVISTEHPGDASMVPDYTYEDSRPKAVDTIRDIITKYRGAGRDDIAVSEMKATCDKAGLTLDIREIGKHLTAMGVPKKRTVKRGTFYDITGVY